MEKLSMKVKNKTLFIYLYAKQGNDMQQVLCMVQINRT